MVLMEGSVAHSIYRLNYQNMYILCLLKESPGFWLSGFRKSISSKQRGFFCDSVGGCSGEYRASKNYEFINFSSFGFPSAMEYNFIFLIK